MADNNTNMIKPVQSLQNMGNLKPVGKRKQKKEQKQSKQNERQNRSPDEMYPDDDFIQNNQEQNDELDGIDYRA